MPILAMAFLSLAAQYDQRPAASLKLDGERLRIGRAPDCDLRLPDLDVARHHASLVRRRDGFALIDEGSPFSTWVGEPRVGGGMHPLLPHVPCPIRGLTSVRIGPFWLVFDPNAKGPADVARARHLFMIELLVRKLSWLGRRPFPTLVVRHGPDRGAWFDLRAIPGLPRLLGRSLDVDFRVRDACTSRKHLEMMCDGDVWVRDLNSTAGTTLGVLPLTPWKFVRWGRGTPLSVGSNVLFHESPLAEALEELTQAETGGGARGAPSLLPPRGVPGREGLRGLQGGAEGHEAAYDNRDGQDAEPVESTIRPKSPGPPPGPEGPSGGP
jgi:pSer/pThr/pTyr-binding forkhead associated (FHA) protein